MPNVCKIYKNKTVKIISINQHSEHTINTSPDYNHTLQTIRYYQTIGGIIILIYN